MDKQWYKKIHIWMPTIAAICTILGISIFGGKSLFGDKEDNIIQESIKIDEEYHRGTITKTGWESKFIDFDIPT